MGQEGAEEVMRSWASHPGDSAVALGGRGARGQLTVVGPSCPGAKGDWMRSPWPLLDE